MIRVGFVYTIDGAVYERNGQPVFVRQNADGLWESDSGWCYTGELVIERFEFYNLPIIFYKSTFIDWMFNSTEEVDAAINVMLNEIITAGYNGFVPCAHLANLRILRQNFVYEKWLSDCEAKHVGIL